MVASLILALVGTNLYIRQPFFSNKNGPLYCRLFSSILIQYVYKLTIWNVVDVLARSSISHSHCAHLSSSCNLGSILPAFILLFSRTVAIAVSLLLFSLLVLPCRSSLFQLLSTIFNSSRHFYCHAFSIAASHFVTIQPDSNYRGFSFKAGPFFCWVAIFALVLLSPYSSCC